MITVAKLQRYGERGLIWITAKTTFIAVMNQTHGNDITTDKVYCEGSPASATPAKRTSRSRRAMVRPFGKRKRAIPISRRSARHISAATRTSTP